jgi:hypothetical protein
LFVGVKQEHTVAIGSSLPPRQKSNRIDSILAIHFKKAGGTALLDSPLYKERMTLFKTTQEIQLVRCKIEILVASAGATVMSVV